MAGVIHRISAYKNTNVKEFKENKRICNLFSHPENYLPILDKYPKLRFCFAHLGGIYQILGNSAVNSKEKKLYNDLLILEGDT